MSKNDFRDRLKSYSITPDNGEWIKMQQLLDADKDDRKTFFWWKYGLLLALVLIPVTILLLNMSSANEGAVSDSISHVSSIGTTVSSIDLSKNTITKKASLETQEENNVSQLDEASSVNRKVNNNSEITDSNRKNNSKKNTAKNNTTKRNSNTGKKVRPSTLSSAESNAIFSRPQANTTSQLKTSTAIKNLIAPESTIFARDENLVADLSLITNLSPSSFELEERALPVLAYSSYAKVYPQPSFNPWYLVSGVGVKYPIVDISEAHVGELVPTQKFFPSYFAEAGIGKNFGRLSVEGGVAASLYQYKLGKILTPEELDGVYSEVQTFMETEEYENRIIEESKTFIINKFAVFSPYLRGQYSFDLKKDFVLGLHAMVHWNRKIELNDQLVSDQFAQDNLPLAQFDNSEYFIGKRSNLNYDIGFSLEKLLPKRGRIAMDFSYSFASGVLEEGSYSILRDSQVQSQGSYKITGMGPKVKFRYYLNLGS